MTLRIATRRLGRPAASSFTRPSTLSRPILGPSGQYRYKWLDAFRGWRGKGSGASSATNAGGADMADPQARKQFLAQQEDKKQKSQATTSTSSIFQDELDGATEKADQERKELDNEGVQGQSVQKTKENMAFITNPDPRAKARWQRKKVIQMVRNRGQLSKEDRIKMTERELHFQSHWMPTSLKKLVMLSRQIAGKSVDDAITQMTWSKKKMAAEVKYTLEEARDLAITSRGMGLGHVNGELLSTPKKIQTKEGKWVEITDPTKLYVAQSWIGRGAWRGKSVDYKGRGRTGIIQHPATSLTLVLKEEKTRIREYEERQTKETGKGPWVHLPNRPVFGQRPYYTW